MKKYLFLGVLLAVLSTMPVSGTGEDKDFFGIEPGWRVGPILMTMSRRDVERIYGEAKFYSIQDSAGHAEYFMLEYKQMGLNIMFKNNIIDEIEVNYPNYSIKNVVRVGSGIDKVEETLGRSFIREDYAHSERADVPDYKMIYSGIILNVKNDRVVKITVKNNR